MSENKKSRIDIVKTVVLMLIVGAVCLTIWLLTNQRETRISTTTETGNYGSLICTSSSPSEPFFVSKNVQRFTHEVTAMFTNEHLKDVSYKYEGTYSSTGTAETAMAELHADYNKYMANGGVYQEKLNPVFTTDKTKVRVSLYAEPEKLNSVVAKLFFLSDDDLSKLSKYSQNDLKKVYEKKGFSCKIHD